MSTQSGNVDSIRRYLLGDLSEPEREQVEERLMADEGELYQHLLIAEDDLIDEYVSGSLSEEEQAKFARRFLHVPELRQDVRFAAALRKHALENAGQAGADARAPSAEPRATPREWFARLFTRPAFGAALAAALLVAVSLAAWLAAHNSQLRTQLEQLQARQTPRPSPAQDLEQQLAAERQRGEQLAAELQRERGLREVAEARRPQETREPQPPPQTRGPARSPVAAFVALTLTPGLVRGSGDTKKISVPPGAREVRVRLDLAESSHPGYRADVKTLDGREVWSGRRLRAAGGKFVQVNIPARLLGPDDYQIVLSGVNSSGESEELGSYYFRVSQ